MHDALPLLAPLAGIWFAAVVSPGPNFLMVSRQAVSRSRTAGLWVALGVALGAGIWALAALAGLQALFILFPWLFSLARLLGGAYLCYLGIKTIADALRSQHTHAAPESAGNAPAHPLHLGLCTSFSNPKTAVFFGSVFGALLPPGASLWLLAASIAMLVTISFLWYGFMACIFSLPGPRWLYLTCKRPLDVLTGGLFSILGARLALDS